MAYGLLRRLTIAWGFTLFLLVNGAFIAWLRGEAWWLWSAFLLLGVLVAALRAAFYRDSRMAREPLSPEALVPLPRSPSAASPWR